MINGVVNIYKEAGFTSHDVVAKLRGMVKQKKIGHTGTLDPAAEGVLPVCLGNATKLCDLLTDWDKTYEAVLLLGVETDTQDCTGRILGESPVEASEEQVGRAVFSFLGDYDQIPPMYSALKVGGKKLYELAREGKEVERSPRRVQIYSLEILHMELPRVRLRVTCSKGTYIRTLCHDIGKRLGCGGCMESLLRTRVGLFDVENSLRLSRLEQMLCPEGETPLSPGDPALEERLGEYLTRVDALFPEYGRCVLLPQGDKAVYNGNALGESLIGEKIFAGDGKGEPCWEKGEPIPVMIYDSRERFMGIYRFIPGENCYKPVKMFLPGR